MSDDIPSTSSTATVSALKPTTNYIANLQYVTTGGAVLLFLRSFNKFISHRQRGQAIVGAVSCVYLSVANEFGLFPFSFFVAGKEKESTKKPETNQ